MMTSLSIATAFAFTLVVATITANPVYNEEKLNQMLNQDPIKGIKYFWNEEIGKDRSARAINPWNDIEEDQKKSFYTMRDNSEDGEKGKDGDGNPWNNIEEDQKKYFYTMKDDGEGGDRDQNGDKGKGGASLTDQNGDKGKEKDRNQNGDKEKDRDQNGGRDKGTLKPIKYVHWNKEKVNNIPYLCLQKCLQKSL